MQSDRAGSAAASRQRRRASATTPTSPPKSTSSPVQTLQPSTGAANSLRQVENKKAAAPFDAAAVVRKLEARLRARQVVRDVIERRVQPVADTLHLTDGGNGNE